MEQRIRFKNGVAFSLSDSDASFNIPIHVDASKMNAEQLRSKLRQGYNDYKAGNVQNAADAFAKFRESHA